MNGQQNSLTAILKIDKSSKTSVDDYASSVKKLNKEIATLQRNMAEVGNIDAKSLKLLDQKKKALSSVQASGRATYDSKANEEALISRMIERAMSTKNKGSVLRKDENINMFSKEDQKLIQKVQRLVSNPEFIKNTLPKNATQKRQDTYLNNGQESLKTMASQIAEQKKVTKAELARINKHEKLQVKQESDRKKREQRQVSLDAQRKRTSEKQAKTAETRARKARKTNKPETSAKARSGRDEREVQRLYRKARANNGNFLGNSNIAEQTPRVQKIWKRVQSDVESSGFVSGSASERASWQKNVAAQGKLMESQLATQAKIDAHLKEAERLAKARTKSGNLAVERSTAKYASANAARPKNDMSEVGARRFQTQSSLIGNYAVLGAGLGGIHATLAFTIELDKAFKQLQSIVRLTDQEMAELEGTLISVSEKTKFTAVEVAEAATVLGQAGFAKDQIEKAIEPITLFATAVGTDLKQAVDLATSVMGVFQMNATEMGNVANIMTTAINKSKLTMDKLSLGLQYSGNLAAQAGIDFKEVVALLGAMANSGIRAGSMLGTGFRQVLIALQAPSDKLKDKLRDLGLSVADIDVRTHGMVNVLKTLTKAGFTSADAMEVLQTRSASAFSAMVNNVDVADELALAMGATESAAEANAIQMTSLANQWSRLKSIALSVGASALDPMKDGFAVILKHTADIVGNLKDLKPYLEFGGTAIGVGILVKSMKWLSGLFMAVSGSNISGGIQGALSGASGIATGRTFNRGVELASGVSGPTRPSSVAINSGIAGLARSGAGALFGPVGIGIMVAGLLGSSLFERKLNELKVEADDYITKGNKADGRFESSNTNINRIDTALNKIYDRSILGEKELTAEILKIEGSFKDLYFSLSDVGAGAKQAIIDLKELKAELVQKAQLANSDSQIAQRGLVKTRQAQLDEALSFNTSERIGTGRGDMVLSNEVKRSSYNLDDLKRLERPTDRESSMAYGRTIRESQAYINKQIQEGGYGEDSTNAKVLARNKQIADDLAVANNNLLMSYLEIDKLSKEAKVLKETAELTNAFSEKIAQVRTDLTAGKNNEIYDKPNSQLEKAEAGKKLQDKTEKEISNLIKEIKGSRTAEGEEYSAGSINATIAPLVSLSGNVKRFGTQKSSDAKPELTAKYDGEVRAYNKELEALQAQISSTTSQKLLEASVEDAKRISEQIENVLFKKNTISIDANSDAERNADDSRRISIAQRNQKLDQILLDNTERLEANRTVAAFFNGDESALDGKSQSFKGSREFKKSIDDRFSRQAQSREQIYTTKLAEAQPHLEVANQFEFQSKKSLGRYGDTGLPVESRQFAATRAQETLGAEAAARSTAILIEIEALKSKIYDPTKGLEFDVLQNERIKNESNPDLAPYVQAETRIKKLQKEIAAVELEISELQVKNQKAKVEVTDEIRELGGSRDLLKYSESSFLDQGRRKIKAELEGGDYITDGNQTQSFQGQSKDIFSQVYDQTAKQFEGFDTMTEAVIGLKGLVDGLGESVGDAMFQFVTGAATASEALRGMLATMVKQLAAAASQMLANQLMAQLFQVGVGAGMGDLAGTPTTGGAQTAYNGGLIYGGAFAGGGYINRGKSQRDSTYVHAAKGEFMVRKEAVDAIGLENMHQLNNLTKSSAKAKASARGAASGGSNVIVPKTETNVYIMDKTTPPSSMQPNDVIAVINDDIIRSGRTRTLIKQVATGTI